MQTYIIFASEIIISPSVYPADISDVPKVTGDKIRVAIQNVKRGKAPGVIMIVTEHLKDETFEKRHRICITIAYRKKTLKFQYKNSNLRDN